MMRLLLVLTAAAALTLLAGLWIPLKAAVAQQLLNLAWAESQAGQGQSRPWPWADTWPVGRLRLPAVDDMVILEGAHGESLAFGPAHISASAMPGEAGTVAIAGHRDTHFRVLEQIQTGDPLAVQGRVGQWRHYHVTGARIVDARREKLSVTADPTSRLILVTCYPFDGINANGPLRYVIEAEVAHDPDTRAATTGSIAASRG